MADQGWVKDERGNVVGRVNAWKPHENHRYVDQLGNCGTCGKNRWHAEHFNGDGQAAALAMEQHRQSVIARNEFVRNLKPGDPVLVVDDHPSSDLQGMTGNVVAVEDQGPNRPRIVTVKFRHKTVAIKSQWLQAVPLPEPPPKFTSQEEADRWLEDTAREMGIKVEPDVPRFTSPEEADEWMRRQQGEPYVPPSWQSTGDKLVDDLAFAVGASTQPLKMAMLKNRRGQHPQMVILDEAQMATDDDIVDPYA